MSNRQKVIFTIVATAAILLGLSTMRGVLLTAPNSQNISPEDAFAKLQQEEIVLVDIRRPDEWATTGVAQGAILLDMTKPDFAQDLMRLRAANPDKPIALICRSSNRSTRLTNQLLQSGFNNILNVSNGMSGPGTGWIAKKLPVVAYQAD